MPLFAYLDIYSVILFIGFSFHFFDWRSGIWLVDARPIVRHIRSAHEFDRVLHKHATETGLPVIADFYSDGCGPCRMMAPIFLKVAKKHIETAVFVKVDTNQIYELSGRYGIRSLPTFLFFLDGKKVNQFSGASEQQLVQYVEALVERSQQENVKLSLDSLKEFYAEVEKTKSVVDIESVWKKCASHAPKGSNVECLGPAATSLARKLKQKYKQAPKLEKRFQPETLKESQSSSMEDDRKRKKDQELEKANLHLASKEELLMELQRREDEDLDAKVELEVDDQDEFEHMWQPGDFPERVCIIGGGPAGMAAALYAARAGLSPVLVAPPMGGQLQGKGVDVENYPGLFNTTGPALIAAMRQQAASYGTKFETDTIVKIERKTPNGPFQVFTNETENIIETHSIIVATGAEAKWLSVPGEYELRGSGVSSCATCDGAAFYNQHVVVVGGGDAAMEDALVLARTSASVTIVHRRDAFRASNILAQRVIEHSKIRIIWNATVREIHGEVVSEIVESDDLDLDDFDVRKQVTGVTLVDTVTNQTKRLDCSAVFVAIGHSPATQFLNGLVDFDEERPGYIKTFGGSTKTSFPGIFAAGDVADSVYRQAITSAGSGAAAALDVERWLSELGLGNEAAEFEAELLQELMSEELSRSKSHTDDLYNVYQEASLTTKGSKESLSSASVEL